jgi:broad specificity phosphatase PhoE
MSSRRRLVLVRHGETVGNSSIRYYGRTDLALSELGRAQMRAASAMIRSRYAITSLRRVFASPLVRAKEGARLVAVDHRAIITVDEFVEVDFGLFEGLTADEIRARYPVEFQHWNKNRFAPGYAYPKGESRSEFAARVERGVARMLAMWQGERGLADGCALLVAHRGVIRSIISHLAGAEPVVELGSIHMLVRENGTRNARWHPEELDLTDHLAGLS